jgi:hypothetical protein
VTPRGLVAPLAALALAALAACQAPAGGVGGVAPAGPGQAAASPKVSAADLTGTWVFGNDGEPAPGAVATCAPDQVLSLAQEGQRVLGSVNTRTGMVRQLEALEGENVAGKVALTGTYYGNALEKPSDVDYVLTFDPASQHLRGTREGTAFWAAPWVDPGSPECPARPSTSPIPTR